MCHFLRSTQRIFQTTVLVSKSNGFHPNAFQDLQFAWRDLHNIVLARLFLMVYVSNNFTTSHCSLHMRGLAEIVHVQVGQL